MRLISAEIHRLARPAIHGLREARHWISLAGRGTGPRVLFLPARGTSDGSSKLRIYAIADQLRLQEWSCFSVSWRMNLAQRHRLIRAFCPDVIVMQGSRHDLNVPSLYPGIPIVYDMDDADFHLPHLETRVRNAIRDVTAVIAGSSYIADWCRSHGAKNCSVVWTSARASRLPRRSQYDRPPVIAWSQSRPATYVKEAALVRETLQLVAAQNPNVSLRLFDRLPADGNEFLNSFRSANISVEWRQRASYRSYLKELDDVAVGLAPLCSESPFSRGKSFGKILAYLDRGVPIVASNCGEPVQFLKSGRGVLANNPTEFSNAILGLLSDSDGRQKMADSAFLGFQNDLSPEKSATHVAQILADVIGCNSTSARLSA